MKHLHQDIVAELGVARVLPILVVDDADQALRVVEILLSVGLRSVELTLRTPAALRAVAAVSKRFPEAVLGVGTVLTRAQLQAVQDAGAHFAISPGITPRLAAAAADSGFPFIPGVATAGEVMLALEHGFDVLKLFPADVVGGTPWLRAIAGPFAEVKFCATGGVTPANAREFLQEPNVLCVGGSWMCKQSAIRAGEWDAITTQARAAAALRTPPVNER
jgi:2-dehydro-3-deoxyphosphogluconate aldolase/(4S)-4-hydroxy-2-oxoglutarate aldolase